MPQLRNLWRLKRKLRLEKPHLDPAANQRDRCPLEHRPEKRPTRPTCMGPSPVTSPDPSERAAASRSRSPLVPMARFAMHLSLARVERRQSTERPLQPYAKLRHSPRRLAPYRVTQSRSIFAELCPQPKSGQLELTWKTALCSPKRAHGQ
jgi:hypothetical protein